MYFFFTSFSCLFLPISIFISLSSAFFFSFFISFSFFFRFFPLRRFPFIISTLDSEFFPFYYHHFSRTVRLQPPLLPPTSPLTPQTAQTATTAATGASIGHHRRHWRLLSLPLSSLSPHTATVVTDVLFHRHCLLCCHCCHSRFIFAPLSVSVFTVTTSNAAIVITVAWNRHHCAVVTGTSCLRHCLCLSLSVSVYIWPE